MIKLLLLGATGSMGKLIGELALNDPEIKVVAACDVTQVGEALGNVVGADDSENITISNVKNLQKVIKETNPDVVVDFKISEATEEN